MGMTRKQFFKGLVGAAALSEFFQSGAASLVFAQDKARVPIRAARIRDVDIFPFSLSQKIELKISLPVVIKTDNVFVRLRTEDGVTGVGEAAPYSAVTSETQESDVAIGRSLAGLLRGRDPFTLGKIIEDMDVFSPDNPSIKAAFEMALWDICGKIAGLPIYSLLGKYRDTFETDKTVLLDTPKGMAEAALRAVREGFRTLKVKVGQPGDADVENIRTIREAVGNNVLLRIDANQGWTAAGTVRNLQLLDQYKIQVCEQPVPYWDWEGLKFVRERSSVPIMADESIHSPHDAIEAVRREAVDSVNIKLMKTGGVLNAVRVAQISSAAGIECMVGCMSESSLSLTAAAHVIASQKNVLYADLDSYLFNVTNPVIGGIEVKQGTVHLPNSPGLGADIDPEYLKSLRPA